MVKINKVIYSNPVTVIMWDDGTKTTARCDSQDVYDELTGFMLCVFKKVMKAKHMRKLFENYVYGDNEAIKRNKIKKNNKNTNEKKRTRWLDNLINENPEPIYVYDIPNFENVLEKQLKNMLTHTNNVYGIPREWY